MKIEGCFFPDNLLYSEDGKLWFVEEATYLRVGLTSLYIWNFGRITSVRYRPVGSKVSAGMSLGWLEGPTHFDSVRINFDCTFIEQNTRLLDQPSLLNKSYYGDGWFALIRQESAAHLFNITDVHEGIRTTISELKVRCFSAFPDIEMYEIGVECSAVLTRLNEMLSSYPPGTVVHIVSDDPTSGIELERWSLTTGNKIIEERNEEGLRHFIVEKV